MLSIRKARIEDIPAVHRILSAYAEKGLLLPRSLSELYDHVRDFFVLEKTGAEIASVQKALPGEAAGGFEVQGVCGLGICWEDLAEIKSLAVIEGAKGQGFGRGLVNRCLEDARHLGIKKVFALTYLPAFFEALGFRRVEKALLPHKIWADCLKCPRFPDCDETAVMMELEAKD